jgi:hypothetical protein
MVHETSGVIDERVVVIVDSGGGGGKLCMSG